MDKFIKPAKHVFGEISLPGDKSIWHRALIISALSEGDSEISGEGAGIDVESTENCLIQLGTKITHTNGKTIVTGKGLHGLEKPDSVLNAGNSGTTVRLLAGVLAAQGFESELDGDNSLRKRPMNRIAAPLNQMGAQISPSPSGGCPLRIRGIPKLEPLHYEMPVASAQIKSALLLAGLCGGVELSLSEPYPSRDHTEIMLEQAGAEIISENGRITLTPASELRNSIHKIPGDFSSAAFFITAALLLPGSELTIKNVGLNGTRTGFLGVIQEMGAELEIRNMEEISGEHVGDLFVKYSELRGVSIGAERVPSIIDELPLIGILGAKADGVTLVSGAGELRVKESDRISRLVEGLRSIGAAAEEFEDGFSIEGKQNIRGGDVSSGNDHRIAMAFAIAGLASADGVTVKNAESASVSYPSFYKTLEEIVGR